MKIRWRWIAYWTVATTFAICRAMSVRRAMSSPDAALADDWRGPDPGTPEYLATTRALNANADASAVTTFFQIMLAAVALWAVWRALRLFYEEIVLRFIPQGL